jgi:hypothetical protein
MFNSGFKFSDPIRDYEIIEYIPKFNMYLLNNLTDNRHDELMDETEIQYYIDNKESITAKRERNRIFNEQQTKREQEEKLQQEAKEKEYNNTYGYTDNMATITKGKVLKVLNKTVTYDNKAYTRKSFIYMMIQQGYEPSIMDRVITSSRKIELERIENYKYNVPALKLNNSFIEITKTEYDFAMYLINNKLVA